MGLLAHTFPVLRRIEAIAGSPLPRRDSIEPRELRVRVFAALRSLLERLAARGPLVVVIDDLQWADADSLALLRELLRGPEAPALLLVVTLRRADEGAPSDPHVIVGAPPGTLGDVRTLTLGPLSSAQTRALAADYLGPSERAVDLALESGGHPLFLQELVRHRMQGGGGPAASLRLDEALWERVSRLDAAAARLLETVVLAGGRITQDVAASATELTTAEYVDHAAGLRAENLVRTTGRRGSDVIEPYHDRVREAVSARLSPEVRRLRHRRLAVALEAGAADDHETLALHWQGAEEPARAAAHAARAAARATEALAFDRGARLYQLALDLGGHDPAGIADLEERLADCLANTGRGPRAALAYRAAASRVAPSRALGLRRRAAEQLLRSGLIDEGVKELGDVLAAVGMRLPPTPAWALASLLARRAQVRLRGIGVREHAEADVPSADLERLDVCLSAGAALGMIDNIRAADFQARGLLLALRAGEPVRVARALAVEACFAAAPGRPGRARAEMLLRASRSWAARSVGPATLAWCSLAEGMVAYCLGEFRRSHAASARAREIFTERCTGASWERETADLYVNLSAFYLGRLPELRAAVERGRRDADERGDLFASTYVRSGLALMSWLARDDPDGAVREAEDTARRWSNRGYFLAHFWCFIARAQIDLYQGDAAAAYQRARDEWSALERSLLLRTVQIIRVECLHLRARAALALALAGGPGAGRLRDEAERDARRLDAEDMPYAAAFAGLLRAALASQRGERARADALLAGAITTFERADMSLYAEVARLRRGELLGVHRGGELVTAAGTWMTERGVVARAAMAAMLAPGFAA